MAERKVGGAAAKKNPVLRTTSETMRLETMGQTPASRKKTSSFQITSVTVGARTSHDAGEDSNDDLDESHTEDNSRLTDLDLETPSYSEDTFSKEDVFFNAANAALSTAPVIPTSSQYGLAIVPSENTGQPRSNNDNNINALELASVTENNIINLLAANAKQDTDLREVHSGRNERFKVVKIESTEPFKRGRWTCMDYLDHTSVNQPTAISTPKVADPNEVCISYGISDRGIVMPDSIKQYLGSDMDKAATIGSVEPNGQLSHQEIMTAQQLSNASNYVPSSLPNAAPPAQQATSAYFPATSQATTQGATMPASLAQGSVPLMGQTTGTLGKDEGYASATTNLQTQTAPTSQANMIAQPDIAGIQMPSLHKVPQAASAAPLQSQMIGGAAASQPQVSNIGGIQTTQPGVAFHPPEAEQDSVLAGNTLQAVADAALLESLAEVTQTGDEQQTLEDNESMSGTSAVAIDNKIEQAMDLVKSHLMFAVREEVEVLKEKIAELMDRINQLEAENALLKAHATPETLAQLSQTTVKLSLNNSGSGQ